MGEIYSVFVGEIGKTGETGEVGGFTGDILDTGGEVGLVNEIKFGEGTASLGEGGFLRFGEFGEEGVKTETLLLRGLETFELLELELLIGRVGRDIAEFKLALLLGRSTTLPEEVGI